MVIIKLIVVFILIRIWFIISEMLYIGKMISSIYQFDSNTYNHVIHCKQFIIIYINIL